MTHEGSNDEDAREKRHGTALGWSGQLVVQAATDIADVAHSMGLHRFMQGLEPVVRVAHLGTADMASLLLDGADVVCDLESRTRRTLVQRGDGWTATCSAGHPSGFFVTVTSNSQSVAEGVIRTLTERAPLEPADEATVPMGVWEATAFGATSTQANVKAPSWDSVARNYPGEVRAGLDDVMRMESVPDAGRLVLWHGPPGTGKTTAVRTLAREWRPWTQAHFVTDVDALLESPSYIRRVLTERLPLPEPQPATRLVIVEDTSRAVTGLGNGDGFGRLLQLTDGLLGQGIDFVLLVTTNEPADLLHEALIRPGRCIALVGFRAFSPAEAAAWAAPERGPRAGGTLAELLAHRGDLKRVSVDADDEIRTGTYL